MQIMSVRFDYANASQYARSLDPRLNAGSLSLDSVRPKMTGDPLGLDYATRSAPLITPDGDVLDLDWNRIRPFVQRYQFKTEPPDILGNTDYQGKNSRPVTSFFSRDGDRVDLYFRKPEFSENVTYGKDDISKSAPIEPKGECGTCDSRRYVDKSSDASVSYQTPTKLNPQTAAAAVAAHEREHVYNERARADREGRVIVSQTVTIKYAMCPECNVMYPSGGTTRTQSVKSGYNEQGSPEASDAPKDE